MFLQELVNMVVKLMFSVLIIDLIIGFLWIGLLGFIELRDTFYKAFPNADLSQFKAVSWMFKKKAEDDTRTDNR